MSKEEQEFEMPEVVPVSSSGLPEHEAKYKKQMGNDDDSLEKKIPINDNEDNKKTPLD